MTSEQIMLALRLVANGRPNHPDVQALAEYLAKTESGLVDPYKPASGLSQVIAEEVQDKPRRGRKPKADQ